VIEKENITTQDTKSKIHPFVGFVVLQGFFTVIGLIFGGFLALILVSIYITVDSAFTVSRTLGYLVVIFLFAFTFLYYNYFMPFKNKKREYIKGYFNLQLLIATLGFVEVIFWMLQPSNDVHEPRATFLVGASAFLAYMKSRYYQLLKDYNLDIPDSALQNATNGSIGTPEVLPFDNIP